MFKDFEWNLFWLKKIERQKFILLSLSVHLSRKWLEFWKTRNVCSVNWIGIESGWISFLLVGA